MLCFRKNGSVLNMTLPDNIKELFSHEACPAIRYQSVKFFDCIPSSNEDIHSELESCEDVQRVLERARHASVRMDFQSVHGSTNNHWENILPMLLDRGLDKSFASFNEVVQPLIIDQQFLQTKRF